MFAAFLSGKCPVSESFGSGVHSFGQQVDTAPGGAASRSRWLDLNVGQNLALPPGTYKDATFCPELTLFRPPENSSALFLA